MYRGARYIPILPVGVERHFALDDLQRLGLARPARACSRLRRASGDSPGAPGCLALLRGAQLRRASPASPPAVNCAVAACGGMFRFGKVPVSVGPPLRPSAVGTSSTGRASLQAAADRRPQARTRRTDAARKEPFAITIMSYPAPSALRVGPHWTSHDNMSRKRLRRHDGRNASIMSKAAEPGKTDAGEAPDVEQYLVKDPERFALNLARMIEQAGKAASAWAEPREKGELRDQRRRAHGRHGQDLLQAHRILAFRSRRARWRRRRGCSPAI